MKIIRYTLKDGTHVWGGYGQFAGDTKDVIETTYIDTSEQGWRGVWAIADLIGDFEQKIKKLEERISVLENNQKSSE
jgi:hypothetical protein